VPPTALSHHREGSGEPLVLLHGIGSRWQVWEPVLPVLSAAREVIALDLPGFGASPAPGPGVAPGVPSLTRLVTEFLDGQGLEAPHVAGNSLGGWLALELARAGRARSATALSPAGFWTPAEAMYARSSLFMAVRAARLAAPRAETVLAFPGAHTLAVFQLVAHPKRIPPPDLVDTVRALAGAPWFDATLQAITADAFRNGGAEIAVPVTIAWGEHDRLLPRRQARRAAAAIPRARVNTLRGCGHVPTYDDPGQVASVLLASSAG
jgi:pimeloyl-ACP methyl ester carboxylesterase